MRVCNLKQEYTPHFRHFRLVYRALQRSNRLRSAITDFQNLGSLLAADPLRLSNFAVSAQVYLEQGRHMG